MTAPKLSAAARAFGQAYYLHIEWQENEQAVEAAFDAMARELFANLHPSYNAVQPKDFPAYRDGFAACRNELARRMGYDHD